MKQLVNDSIEFERLWTIADYINCRWYGAALQISPFVVNPPCQQDKLPEGPVITVRELYSRLRLPLRAVFLHSALFKDAVDMKYREIAELIWVLSNEFDKLPSESEIDELRYEILADWFKSNCTK